MSRIRKFYKKYSYGLKKLSLGKSDNFLAHTMKVYCASLIRYELSRMADPLRGAQGGSLEVCVTVAKYFSEIHNQLITMAMAKIC